MVAGSLIRIADRTICADATGVNSKAVNEMINNSHEAAQAGDETTSVLSLDGTRILDHDHVFWLGDLNYRIDDCTLKSLLSIDFIAWLHHVAHSPLARTPCSVECRRGF